MKTINLPQLPDDCTQDSQLSRPTVKKAWKILDDYIDGKSPGSDKVKIAASVINAHSRTLAAESNRAAIRMMAAKLSMREEDPLEKDNDKIKLLK